MEQHIEFGTGSAASAAMAEAFEHIQRILADFALSEIRAAAAVASGPGWAMARRKPPSMRSAVCPLAGNRVQRTVKAGVG